MASPVARRSSSLPLTPAPSRPDSSIDILCNIPSEVRIIAFTAIASSTSRPGSSCSGGGDDEVPGLSGLPWTSRFERTLAIGPLRVYRAPGSVAFLSCASALRPILPKSKCWAVDEDANTFILQVNPPQYWRIEVPKPGDDEPHWGQALKLLFQKVLMFEKTPCPFSRSFTVDLPSPPRTPVRRRPWKPVQRPKLSLMQRTNNPGDAPDVSPEVTNQKEQKKAFERFLFEMPESELVGAESSTSSPVQPSSVDETMFVPKVRKHSTVPDGDFKAEEFEHECSSADQQVLFKQHSEIREPDVLKQCNRSITAPPLLTLATSPPSKSNPTNRPDTASSDVSSSIASFHTIQSWHSPLSDPHSDADEPSGLAPQDTFPYPHENIIISGRFGRSALHSRETSELTLTPSSDPPRTPPLLSHEDKSDEEDDEVRTPPSPRSGTRHRSVKSGNMHRRTLSPLPPAMNLLSSTSSTKRLRTARHLPTAIIQKTCEILLSPPSHLLHLMLRIAAKIASGEWRGIYGVGEEVHWDLAGDAGAEIDFVDDYGISLPKLEGRRRAGRDVGGSCWDID